MNDQKKAGAFYIVATPIGNLGDITQRALTILQSVDLIAAEDTRHSQRLLSHYGIKTPLLSLHEHNETQRITQVLTFLQEGKSIALISDAGTPVISDPGYRLIAELHRADIKVVPIPGPCAAIAALSAAGLSAEEFLFLGFLPPKRNQRREKLNSLIEETRTWLCYEAPHRILDLLEDMQTILGDHRYVVIAREITKQFETIHGTPLGELIAWMKADTNQERGEFVVLVQGKIEEDKDAYDLEPETIRILGLLAEELPLKQAVKLTASITQEKKNRIYDYAIENLKKN
jgi:16S rRNA (cytidine1402-2'-O)-methyltransferase